MKRLRFTQALRFTIIVIYGLCFSLVRAENRLDIEKGSIDLSNNNAPLRLKTLHLI
jgi:hypothetical protein